jgi:CheY-specific phosphatase CheX
MVDKLRSMNQLSSLKIYAVVANDQEAVAERSLYNGVVARSFVPEVFQKSLDRVLPSGFDVGERLPDLAEQLKPALISATEQVCGMMMSTEISVADGPSPIDPSTPMLIATLGLVSYTEEKRIKITVSCDRASALTLAKRMLREEEGLEGTEFVTSSLAEVLNIIGGRLRNTLGEVQREFSSGLPSVEERLAGALAFSTRHGSVTSFHAEDQLCFSITLLVESCEKFKVSRSNLSEGLVLAQTLEVNELGKLAKGLRLDGATVATLQNYGPKAIEIFDEA